MSDEAKRRESGQDEPRTHHQGLGFEAEQREKDGSTRRSFLKGGALGAAGLLVFKPGRSWAARSARIVRAYHDDATSGWTTINQEPVNLMVHRAVCELTGLADTAQAWASLFPGLTVDKKVAIKINLACGDVPTHPEVVNAIIDGILMVDIGGEQLPEENIIVWDWDNAFFCDQTGYPQNWGGPGVQYVGTDHPSLGFDYSKVFPISHPLGSTTNHSPSKIITQHCDYLINAGVIKDHSDSDVTLCLKNHYGSFSGVPVYQMHVSGTWGDGHERGEPHLNMFLRDGLGDKTVLHLIDATYGLFEGGPGYIPPYHTPPNWIYNSVIVGFDPVATDRVGTEKINEKRVHEGYPVLDPSHVSAAGGEPFNLGTDDMADIDLIEIDAADMTDIPHGLSGAGAMLFAPYPNPARDESHLSFSMGVEADAEMLIVDVRGRLVRRLAAGHYGKGVHRLVWNGQDEKGRSVPSGVYFAKLVTRGGARRRKLVLMR